MRILFITSTRIGDAVLSTALLNHLLKEHPDAKFTICAGQAAAPLFEGFPNLEKLIVVNKKPLGRHWLSIFAKTVWRKWDIIVDMRRSAISYFLWHNKTYSPLKEDGDCHKVETLGKMFDVKADQLELTLWPTPEHEKAARALISPKDTVLALGATANWSGKQWAADKYSRLAKRLTAEGGILENAKILVFGTEEERHTVRQLIDSLPSRRCIDLLGKTDLLTAYCIMKNANMFIGNDTGLMHIAAASGCPTLALFGPSRDELYRPWSKLTKVVRTDLSFEEIVSSPEFDHKQTKSYMHSLSVEKVEEAANLFWLSIQKNAPRQEKRNTA